MVAGVEPEASNIPRLPSVTRRTWDPSNQAVGCRGEACCFFKDNRSWRMMPAGGMVSGFYDNGNIQGV